jgi:hypothetical protein
MHVALSQCEPAAQLSGQVPPQESDPLHFPAQAGWQHVALGYEPVQPLAQVVVLLAAMQPFASAAQVAICDGDEQ